MNQFNEAMTGIIKIRDISVSTVTRLRGGRLRFDSRQEVLFLYATASRSALSLSQPSIQCVLGGFSSGVKWPVRESDHSPPSASISSDLRNVCILPQYFATSQHKRTRLEPSPPRKPQIS